MHFNGDWAKGEFTAAGQTPGKEYGCTLVGDSPKEVIGGDVFVFPATKDKAQLATQDKLIEVLLDPTTPARVQQEEGLDPGAHGRGRLLHGRLRPEIPAPC